MSTLNEQIQAVLTGLATGGAWPVVSTQLPTVYPYITYSAIVTPTNNTFEGPTDLQIKRYQIDVVSLLVSEAVTISSDVRAAMTAATEFGATPATEPHDLYDDKAKAFKRIADYYIASAD